MTGYRFVSLADVATIERRAVDPQQSPQSTVYIGLDSILSGGGLGPLTTVGDAHLTSTKFAFSEDHVLFGKLRPYLAKVATPDFDGICSTDVLPIAVGPDIDRRYLARYLLQPEVVRRIASQATGANLPRISPAHLARLRIPLPDMQEQRRIADVLDLADALLAKRHEWLALLDDLQQSIFLEMFGDLVSNTHGLQRTPWALCSPAFPVVTAQSAWTGARARVSGPC